MWRAREGRLRRWGWNREVERRGLRCDFYHNAMMRWLSDGFLLCFLFLPEGHVKCWDVNAGGALRDDPGSRPSVYSWRSCGLEGKCLTQGHSEFFSRAVWKPETWVFPFVALSIQDERMLLLLLVHSLYWLISKTNRDSEENWSLGSNQNNRWIIPCEPILIWNW